MLNEPHIVVADDESSVRLMLEIGLTANGFRVTCARTSREALEAASKAGGVDGVLTDAFIRDGDCVELIKSLRAIDPDLPIVLMTGLSSHQVTGASDSIAKPFEISAMVALLRQHVDARSEAEAAAGVIIERDLGQSGLAGRSAPMVTVYKLIGRAARATATVLITGEPGTEKALVARAIHDLSARSSKLFLSLNCAGLTETRLECELFGHIDGASTGAGGGRAGLFETAEGGTVFLDELASTSPIFQDGVIRVQQCGEVHPVGSSKRKRVNVRVMVASSALFQNIGAARGFGFDLFYSLGLSHIALPALRERVGDVELLAAHFLQRFGRPDQAPPQITPEAMRALRDYSFPGNVRELERAVRHAVTLSSNGIISVDCLPPEIVGSPKTVPNESSVTDHHLFSDRPSLGELERRYLRLILEESGWNRRRTAAILDLDRRTVQRLIARYQLDGLVDREPDSELDEEGKDIQ